MYSNENISMKYFDYRSITTFDLELNDLEWDKSDLNRHLPESDRLSSYDINEMTEILQHHFLEFDMSSQIEEYENQIKKQRFYRSLSNINLQKQEKQISLISKHFSLMNIKSIQWNFLKSRDINLRKEDYHHQSISQSIKIKSDEQFIETIIPTNLFHLSKLTRIHLYLIKIKDKCDSFIFEKFQSRKIPIITNEIIETYDIIQE